VFHATDCEAAALNERLGVCWMVSAVARVMRPGCKVDTTLILVGDQGARKSTAIRILASGPWFADTILDLQNKDFYENIQGVWLYELQELDSLRHREWTRVKAVLSSQEDRWRRPYGRRTEAHQRQVCFVGTTNESQFLGDPTGARRFWPVRCRGVVDVEALERDRDQLWAEAVVRFKRGERWHLEGEEVAWAAAIADRFRHEDPWEEPVACWAGGQERFTLTECWRGALNREGREAPRAESMRLADVLRRVGYETKERRRVGYGAQVRLWGRVDGFGAGEPGVIYSGLATGQAPGEF
jgi:putative DNA primase/helicase